MILVTGHRGYIGSHVYKELVRLGYEVHGIDLKDGEDILHCLPDKDFDYVFHLAALPRVEYSVENPSYTLRQNVLVTSSVLEWAKSNNVKRVIFSSSSAAIGDGTGPKSPYGLHKLMNEMECRLYSELYGLDTVCLRYFNVYSEEQPYGGSYSTAIHVEDIVSANLFCMQHEEHFNGKWLNVGSGKSVSMNYIKDYIDLHNDVEWNHAPARKGDVRHTMADISELRKIGWDPKISIEEGLARCFKKVI